MDVVDTINLSEESISFDAHFDPGFPMMTLRCKGIQATPVYGSFWRWLLRRPTHWLVEIQMEDG